MFTTDLHSPTQAPKEPCFGDEVAEFVPWLAVFAVLGPLTLFIAMFWAPFLLVGAVVLVLALVATVLALGAAILATPYLLVRHVHRRFADRRKSEAGPVSVPRVIGGTAVNRSGAAGLGEHATLGGSR